MSMEFKRVTLMDVAKEANVSYATVSAVINGKDGQSIRVGKETKEKILECAARLGYVPNLAAQKLKHGRNSMIAVFTYENMFPVESRNEFYRFFVGIQEAAEKIGYDLLILNNRPTAANRSSRISLADGAVMIGINRDDNDILQLLKRKFPLVFVGRREAPGVQTHWVTFDYRSVIRQMIGHIAPSCQDGLVYIEDVGFGREPRQDKRRYLYEIAEEKNIQVTSVCADEYHTISPENMRLVFQKRVAVLDRLNQIVDFELQCVRAGLVLGTDIVACVLEDDWEGGHAHWTRWTDRRVELGSLAVEYLSLLLKGDSLENLPRLVALELVKAQSSGAVTSPAIPAST